MINKKSTSNKKKNSLGKLLAGLTIMTTTLVSAVPSNEYPCEIPPDCDPPNNCECPTDPAGERPEDPTSN